MAVLTYEAIVDEVREKFSLADVSSIKGTLAFQFNIEGKGEGVFYVEVKDGKLSVEPYDYRDNNAVIRISGANLIKLIDGKLDPVLAFTTRKLRVDGDINSALEIIKFIK